MAKKDFTQTAFSVVQQATGEAAQTPAKTPKEAAPKVIKAAAKKSASKPRKVA